MMNKAMLQGLPRNWQENWVKALFKGGNQNQLTNYRTIMVGSCVAKFFGSIVEQDIIAWDEDNGK